MNKNIHMLSTCKTKGYTLPIFTANNTLGNIVSYVAPTILYTGPELYTGMFTGINNSLNFIRGVYATLTSTVSLSTISPLFIKGIKFKNSTQSGSTGYNPSWINVKSNGSVILSVTGRDRTLSAESTHYFSKPITTSLLIFEFESGTSSGNCYVYPPQTTFIYA